ncbi:MAG TPA: L,D-transpeptidase [Acidimicrobiia bacterium]|nr:L,D-transpeptidase [Acidimicrobiia bacterium]
MRLSPRQFLLALAGVATITGCGSIDLEASPAAAAVVTTTATPTTTTTASTTTTTTATTTTTIEPDAPATRWTAALTDGPTDVFESPRHSEPYRTLETHTILGTPTVVLVLGQEDEWLEVMLPGRPNGEMGWVRASDVEQFAVLRHAVVDLKARTLQVLEDEEVVFETAVGVGSPSSPTPTGMFFVTDAVRITNPNGPWGPYAFGLSARSDTVTEFNGGDGIIGIHGTNRPNSIGEAQSLGCVRLPNEVMLEVARLLAVGSPVLIKA